MIKIKPDLVLCSVGSAAEFCSLALHAARGKAGIFLASYGKDFLEPFAVYTILRGFKLNSLASAGIAFGYPLICEFGQKYGLMFGTYDPNDFIAYALGTGTGILLNEGILFRSKNKGLESVL